MNYNSKGKGTEEKEGTTRASAALGVDNPADTLQCQGKYCIQCK